jgi:hypothetical protein
VEEQILAQYRRFWTQSLPAAEAAPADGRRALLAPVAMEPALSYFVAGIAELDRLQQRAYGSAIPVKETLKRRGDTVLVTGCLDSSGAGKVDAKSGKVLTKGPEREKVLVTLMRGKDRVWRFYQTGFPEDYQC